MMMCEFSQRHVLREIKKFVSIFICSLIVSNLFFTSVINAENSIPAFPGAEGAGKWATGGRGGKVIEVTNLNDKGPGSLRDAINQKGPRIVVFRVAGTIELKTRITIQNSDITIAGQTAPGDGICLKGGALGVQNTNNVIIRYLRVRLGTEGGQSDTMGITSSTNVIIDHCSASWSVDETLSTNNADKSTVQWCIISESLNHSIHTKGDHGFGSLLRGAGGATLTFHHNLYAHNNSRNPRPGNYADYTADPKGGYFEFTNNVVYNWGYRAGYNADTDSVSNYNFINNYYKKGPNTQYDYIFNESSPYAKAYFSGNSINGSVPEDPWSLVKFDFDDVSKYKQTQPFNIGDLKVDSADAAYKKVLKSVGASLVRDAADKRVIDNVKNGTGKLIDKTDDVGGWPELKSAEAPQDSDHDGMPDSWERSHKLNPNDAADAALDRNNDGYTNIEEYINSLLEKDAGINLIPYAIGGVGTIVIFIAAVLILVVKRKKGSH